MDLKPGLHKLTFSEYLSLPGINHSILTNFGRSAAHAHEAILHPEESTKAQARGQAVHCALLEPGSFESKYVAAPDVTRRTKAGKAAWAALEKGNPSAFVLSAKDMAEILAMARAVLTHPTAAQLLGSKGVNEISALWVDEKTGETCKARLDRYTAYENYPLVVDIKTTCDASLRSWQRDVHKYGLHRQAAWYISALDTLMPLDVPRRFCWICVESERPYVVACYEIDSASLEQGAEENRRHLDLYHACKESGEWPGYTSGLVYAGLPHWAYSNLSET
jgi:hypothetical protein